MGNDTIGSMITCIRNANLSKAKTVEVPATQITRSIANILLQEGYIANVRERQYNAIRMLVITLKYQTKTRKPHITIIKYISKPGLRVYSNHQDIPQFLGEMGIVILSTSKGIMMHREARAQKVGGEVLCYVW